MHVIWVNIRQIKILKAPNVQKVTMNNVGIKAVRFPKSAVVKKYNSDKLTDLMIPEAIDGDSSIQFGNLLLPAS